MYLLPAFVVLISREIVRQRRWRRLATEDAGVDKLPAWYDRKKSSILWLNGPGGTPTSSFKSRIAKQGFTFAILTLCTPHLRTAVHLCNRTEVPGPWRFGTNTCTVRPLVSNTHCLQESKKTTWINWVCTQIYLRWKAWSSFESASNTRTTYTVHSRTIYIFFVADRFQERWDQLWFPIEVQYYW